MIRRNIGRIIANEYLCLNRSIDEIIRKTTMYIHEFERHKWKFPIDQSRDVSLLSFLQIYLIIRSFHLFYIHNLNDKINLMQEKKMNSLSNIT